MPLNANDPLRTTDPEPSAAMPGRDHSADFGQGSSAVDGGTGAYVPGQDAEPMVAVPERGPGSVAVPGYAIEAVLGRGGMGVVYRARHLTLKRTVALKMVRAGGHAGPHELARFRIEAEAVVRLQHPNIVQIHEVGEAEGHPYCALEFVEGGNLASAIGGKPMPAKEAAKLVEALARAMQLAHSRNVVHRDLKPANVLLTADGTPKITDFGLARQMDSDSGETQAGAVMGTPSYMAPEQASGHAHEAGPAADVYALGAILYDCLAGRPPFKGKTVVETLDQVRTQEPAPPSRRQASVPLDLDTVCLKCLRKEPEKRYASAAELADELARYLRGEPILARPVGWRERTWKWAKRNPSWMASLAVVMVLLAGTTVAGVVIRQQGIAKQKETHAAGLVQAVLNAETAQVPAIARDMAEYRKWTDPLLREQYETAGESRQKLRLALALLPVDDSQINYLREQLPVCTLEQLPVVRSELLPHKAKLMDALWRVVQDESLDAPRRFQAAAALAAYAPDDKRWQKTAPFVAQHLTSAISLMYLGQWRQLFQPASKALASPLAGILADRSRSEKQREATAFVLSDYLRDQPRKLTDSILAADELAEYSPLVEALKPHAATVKQPLLTEMRAAMPVHLAKNNKQLSDDEQLLRDARWKRQSLAAVTLVNLGYGDEVWSLLKFSPDPSLRSFIIHYLGQLGTNYNTLAARLELETEVSIRRALIQSLGGLDSARIPPADRHRIAERLQSLYVHDPDPGIHSSASWTLRKWGVALAELPVGEPVLTDEQKTRIAKLTSEVDAIRDRIVASEQELPALQAAWERQLREQPAALPVSLSEGLVAHYPLDETEGKEIANAVKVQPGGVYAGPGQPEWVPGVMGHAVRLNGKGGHFTCGEAFNPERTDSFSYGCWFLADAKSKRGVLFGKFKDSEERGYAVDVDPATNAVICEWSHHYPDNTLLLRVIAKELVGRWHHLFVNYDGSSSAAGVKIYIDGRLMLKRVEADKLSESIQTSTPLQIGKRDTSFAFHGAIDDMRIYNRRLSDKEVQHLYESGVRSLAGVPAETRTPEQQALLTATYRSRDEPLQALESQLAAAETVLRDARWNCVRRWYVNGQGQTMVVVPIAADNKKSQINKHIAISSREVTLAEFRRFRQEPYPERSIAPTDNCPVYNLSWYAAAEYCNWLSKQEGIPENQWVYQPNSSGKYAAGMKIKENSLELMGYRLPTEAEWESACRAGASGSYGFGEPVPLLKHYCWYAANSSGHNHSVESLLPNEAGLFDMHGNSWEWTRERAVAWRLVHQSTIAGAC